MDGFIVTVRVKEWKVPGQWRPNGQTFDMSKKRLWDGHGVGSGRNTAWNASSTAGGPPKPLGEA